MQESSAPQQAQLATNKTATMFNLYLANLEKSGFAGTEPFLTDKIRTHIKHIAEQGSDFSIIFSAKSLSLKDIFVCYAYLMQWHSWLITDYNIFQKYRFITTQEGSYTSSGHMLSNAYLANMDNEFANISEQLHLYENIISSNLIIDYFLKLQPLKTTEDLLAIRELYEQYFKAGEGPLVITLYVAYLQTVLDDKNSPKESIRQIIRDVEILKTSMLMSAFQLTAPQSEKNKSLNIVQRLVQKYNLSPDAASRAIPEIIDELRPGSNFEQMTDMREICTKLSNMLSAKSEKKFGFIIIRKLWISAAPAGASTELALPIEHNIYVLIDRAYLLKKELLQPASVGVNLQSIQRGETMRILQDFRRPASLTDSLIFVNAEHVVDSTQNYYYVLETIDGIHFHFLLPWANNINSGIKYLPAAWLENLEKIDLTPSRRLLAYNHILNNVIVSKLSAPFMEIKYASRMEAKKEDLYWTNLRAKIKDEILLYIGSQLTDDSTLTIKKFDKLITDPIFYQNVINIITQQISLDLTNPTIITSANELRQRQWKIEMILSYFKDIDHIQKQFRHDLIEAYHKEGITKIEQAFNGLSSANIGTHAMIRNKLNAVFGDLLLGVLERYINRRSNIYLLLDRKSELLNKTLFR